MTRIVLLSLLLLGAAFLSPPAAGGAENPYRLRDGARGKRCLKCHEAIRGELTHRYVHPLMKKGTCTGCHDPHTSSHADLLLSSGKTLCYDCHRNHLLPDDVGSVHPHVLEGECGQCHNSHGSDHRYLLKQDPGEICLTCHEEVGEKARNARFPHAALTKNQGCLNCHEAHASTEDRALLKKEVSALCRTCHQTRSSAFRAKHLQYPVANADCIACHDVHGSNRKGMLYASAHAPFEEKKCDRCHTPPTGGKAIGVRKEGAALCSECHQEMLDETWNRNRVHWPLRDEKACLHCHNPHAAKREKLVKGPTAQVCGACHEDTVERQAWSRANPENEHLCAPVKTGACDVCHDPHGSDQVLLMREKDVSTELCGRCHEWQRHSSHPLGEKVTDPRDPNLTVECVSCHKGCGTENHPMMLQNATTYELCVQCHEDRRR